MAPLLYLVLALQAGPATVSGRVTDGETGEPLAAAVVMLTDLDRLAVTDAAGAYVLDRVPAGPQHLAIRLLGYAPRTLHALVPAAGPLVINVTLERAPILLSEVAVQPPLALRGAEAVPAAAAHADRALSIAAIRNHPLLAEPDAFAALAGGDIVVAPEAPTGVHVRGGAADQVAYLLDGVPVFSPYHAGGLFGAWNPDALARVELTATLPAPGSAAALTGIISGVTRTPTSRISGAGSVTTTQTRITIDGPLGGGGRGFLLSLRSAYPGFIAPGDEASYLSGESGDAIAKVVTRMGGGELRLLGYQSANEIAVATSVDAERASERNRFEWSSHSLGAAWRRQLGATTLLLDAWHAVGEARADWRPEDGSTTLATRRGDEGLTIAARRATPAAVLAAGVRVARSRTAYRIVAHGDSLWSARARTPLATAFVEQAGRAGGDIDYDVVGSVTAAAGGVHPGFGARLRWSPRHAVRLGASLARTHQFAQSARNAESVTGSVFPADLHVGAGARDVPVARSDQQLVSAEYEPTPGVRLALQAYHRRARGLVIVAAGAGEPFATGRLATGSSATRGIALDGAVGTARYGLILGYGWQHTRFAHERDAFAPSFAAAHTIESGAILFPSPTASVRVGVTTWLGRRGTPVSGSFEWEACNLLDRGCEFAGTPHHDPALLGTARLPAYVRIDAGVRKHWHVGLRGRDAAVALFATVTNLLGRRNVLTYAREPGSEAVVAVEMRPRAPLVVGADWRF